MTTYTAKLIQDGKTQWTCGHKHKTLAAAQRCLAKHLRRAFARIVAGTVERTKKGELNGTGKGSQ